MANNAFNFGDFYTLTINVLKDRGINHIEADIVEKIYQAYQSPEPISPLELGTKLAIPPIPQPIKIVSDGHYFIRGRGKVITANEKDNTDVNLRNLTGKQILVDEVEYYVLSVEVSGEATGLVVRQTYFANAS